MQPFNMFPRVQHGFLSLFKESEFLSINCPATPETKNIINKNTLSYLKENTVVGNAARGDVVDDDAMVEALKNGTVFAYGLDVYNGEPKIHPEYLKLKNILGVLTNNLFIEENKIHP